MTIPEFITLVQNGGLRLTGHRISIEDIAHCYREGYTPEMMLSEFPTLSLPLIHKAIAFYLENRPEIDAIIAQGDAEFDRQRAASPGGPGMVELRRRLESLQSTQTP